VPTRPGEEHSVPLVGQPAPEFELPAANGGTVRLADFRGKQVVVLYFYPKDNTPGCTREACEFRDRFAALARAGVALLGVSPDSVRSHDRFTRKHDLPFILLADEKHRLIEAYGVRRQKKMLGRKYMGVSRTTFVIDKQGRVAHIFEKVKPDGHAQEVLDWIRANLQ